MEPRPDVIVDFVFEDGMLFVAVQNIGSQPALQVHVAFDPPFKGLGGTTSIPELPLFRNIEFLAPSRSIGTLLDSSAAYSAAKSLNGSPPLPLTLIGRGRNSPARCSTILPSIAISRLFQNRKGPLPPMAILRDAPYGNQHFRVDLGTGADGPAAGFSHIVLPDIAIDIV